METKSSNLDLFLVLLLLAFAVILVDDRWVRAGVTIVPALLLVQRASVGVASGGTSSSAPAERRVDGGVREHVDELLKQIREFYTTCHMLAGGKLDPESARERAAGIERNLNGLLAKVSDASKS